VAGQVKVYVYPKGLVSKGRRPPLYVWMKSIYKGEPKALICMATLQGEEGSVTLYGNEELCRNTEWGTKCFWCKKKYYLDNMLIIVDEDETKSVMCPSCYKEIMVVEVL
jgi:hypothetical protein